MRAELGLGELEPQLARDDAGDVEQVLDQAVHRSRVALDRRAGPLALRRGRGRSGSRSETSPSTEFSGVRSSWLIVARKLSLARLVMSAASRACAREVAASVLDRAPHAPAELLGGGKILAVEGPAGAGRTERHHPEDTRAVRYRHDQERRR